MNADYPCKQETDTIIGCAFAVLNDIGHGYHEKPYENSLVVEFEHRDIPYLQQPRYPITYRDKQVAEYIPDLIAFNKVIVDTKVIERITDHEIGQMINYLKVTGLPVGLILNFKQSKLEFRRVVASTQNFIQRKKD
ncbi:MAG: GxxExxY protein [Akkermansiaceae bacterium]|jgi:GxxExxY protein|nr:GxxExxY protein [Akkermansiaceae bacterium]MDP4645599.1 GxxExxY protein [Akkermansiaceae bacterium]MDP4719962.1 GxxExxY protein [Akkermansiaceae bacterium]MDP4779791.1 GxxExxY protein [Akkermansiaceae bacterium]MDP4896794.1 GxxExxY protein [Akkermansiaceae bacterium]